MEKNTNTNTNEGTAFRIDYSNRDVVNVCGIFKDVTGKEAKPEREASTIMNWLKKGWGLHDFRMIIEYCFHDQKASEYFKTPGRMNLRSFLNPSRGEVLEDILLDLRHADQIQKKRENDQKATPTRELKLFMRCGSKIYRDEYAEHMNQCFQSKGACFTSYDEVRGLTL